MIKGNKGEWSEIYTLLKLLGDKELHPGDSNLNRIAHLVYPILKILRSEAAGDFEYAIDGDFAIISGAEELRIPVSEFRQKAKNLLQKIKEGEGAFEEKETEDFMQSIRCHTLKAKATSKTDIVIVVHDQRTGLQPALGFSIKSQLGSASTLLNAGETTNFIFRITNTQLTQAEVEMINNIKSQSKIRDRVQEIMARGGKLEFIKTQRAVFGNNLVLIDSLLPQIMANLLVSFFTTGNSGMEVKASLF